MQRRWSACSRYPPMPCCRAWRPPRSPYSASSSTVVLGGPHTFPSGHAHTLAFASLLANFGFASGRGSSRQGRCGEGECGCGEGTIHVAHL